MGESTDSSSDSDESIEAQERSDDQATGAFGGSGTNVGDESIVLGFLVQMFKQVINKHKLTSKMHMLVGKH